MAITGPVHQATGTAVAGTSISVTITAPTSGNSLVATIVNNSGRNVSSISGGGCTWDTSARIKTNSSTTVTEIWVGANSSGSGTTVTINFNLAVASSAANVSEWAGATNTLAGTVSTDKTNSNTGTTGTPNTGAITNTKTTDLVIYVCGALGTTFTETATFGTALSTGNNAIFAAGYQIETSSTGPFTGTTSTSGTVTQWAGCILSVFVGLATVTTTKTITGQSYLAAAAAGVEPQMMLMGVGS